MKKKIMTIAGSMAIGLTSIFAQTTNQTQNNNSATQQNTYQQPRQEQQQNQNTYQSPVQQQPQVDGYQNQQQPQLNQQPQNNQLQTTPQPQTNPTQTTPQLPTDPQSQDRSTYPNQNHMMVQPNELPSSMQQSLQGPEYRGWEDATFYRDRNTGEYSFQLREGNQTPRTLRFDRNGRAIDEANKPNSAIRGPEGAKDID